MEWEAFGQKNKGWQANVTKQNNSATVNRRGRNSWDLGKMKQAGLLWLAARWRSWPTDARKRAEH